MLLKEIFCYAVFAITITATCAESDNHLQDSTEKQNKKRLTKREAAIFVVDDLPGETVPRVAVRTKKVYKRMSKPRHRAPKHELSPLAYSKYKGKKLKSTYSAASGKKRLPVTWRAPVKTKKSTRGKLRRPLKKPTSKRLPRPVRKRPTTEYPPPRSPHSPPFAAHSSPEQEPMSFGEPPADYQSLRAPYQEIPVDSYGAPLKPAVIAPNPIDPVDPADNLQENNNNFEVFDIVPDYTEWQVDPHADSNFASNTYQPFARPSKFEKNNDFPMSIASDYNDLIRHLPNRNFKKALNKFRLQSNLKNEDDKVLVGGQYAEPPGRYITMLDPKEKFFDESAPFSSNAGYMDVETTQAVSPYVNYKNSNMAFSPQNLNDAFSLDK